MTRAPSARTIAVRDTVLLILRDHAPLPISTPEVLRAITNNGRSCNSYLTRDGHCRRPTGLMAGEPCPGWCWHQPVYPQLLAMAVLGLVERIHIDGHRCVYWRYIEQETDQAFNTIIAGIEDTDA